MYTKDEQDYRPDRESEKDSKGYTKGEWIWGWEDGQPRVRSTSLMPVCVVYPLIGRDSGSSKIDEAEANAHLIAAAPDMYEALKAIAEMKVMPISYIEIAKNIITKAEGK